MDKKSKIIQKVASVFHEKWRENRLMKNGKYKSMIEKSMDEKWIKQHGTNLVDIANTKFEDLPVNWKYENLEAAKVAVELVYKNAVNKEVITPEKLEEMARIIHDEWLRRNGIQGSFENQRLDYEELSEEEKEKDRVQIYLAVNIIKEMR